MANKNKQAHSGGDLNIYFRTAFLTYFAMFISNNK